MEPSIVRVAGYTMEVGTLAQWVSGLATLGAVLLALFGDWIRSRIFRPKLIASLASEHGEATFIVRIPEIREGMTVQEYERWRSAAANGGERLGARYFHIRVENTAVTKAHDVRLYLVRLEEQNIAGAFVAGPQIELPMNHRHGGSYPPRKVMGEPALFDALSVDAAGTLTIQTAIDAFAFQRMRQGALERPIRLYFVARSDEIESNELGLEIYWSGKWASTWEELSRSLQIKDLTPRSAAPAANSAT